MIHEDGTMDVLVNGLPERRSFRREPVLFGFNCAGRVVPQSYLSIPDHDPDTEILVQMVGRDPEIVRR